MFWPEGYETMGGGWKENHLKLFDKWIDDTCLMPQSVASHPMTRRMTMRRTRMNVWHQRPLNWVESSQVCIMQMYANVIHCGKHAISISICLKQMSELPQFFQANLKTLTLVHVGSVMQIRQTESRPLRLHITWLHENSEILHSEKWSSCRGAFIQLHREENTRITRTILCNKIWT